MAGVFGLIKGISKAMDIIEGGPPINLLVYWGEVLISCTAKKRLDQIFTLEAFYLVSNPFKL
jgi:hypothetical protein